ncbi:hypothetical protein BC938DRAFT_472704 [Jimgerdemannia flammicorona]|uniref:Uncharacterized protein n=1 Tax=Jimgerdemannia flammicorona TaxID=994334 RepID=A0A433QTV6_9FUNG|nr:hypothetical protein BC938DRAFT_472704 [Jimgerdemannia flammicorona]
MQEAQDVYAATLCRFAHEAGCEPYTNNRSFSWKPEDAKNALVAVGRIQKWWFAEIIMQFADILEHRHHKTLRDMEEYLSEKDEFEQRDKKEKEMQRALVKAVKEQTQLPGFHYLYDFEWPVNRYHSKGRGDLVFASATGIFAVVETKYIDSNKSARTQNVRSDFVIKQADSYREEFMHMHPEAIAVVALVCVNNGRKTDDLQVIPVGGAYRVIMEAVPEIDSEKVDECRRRASENYKISLEDCHIEHDHYTQKQTVIQPDTLLVIRSKENDFSPESDAPQVQAAPQVVKGSIVVTIFKKALNILRHRKSSRGTLP